MAKTDIKLTVNGQEVTGTVERLQYLISSPVETQRYYRVFLKQMPPLP